MEGEQCDYQKWTHMSNMSSEQLWQFLKGEETQETVNKIPTFLLLCILMAVGIPGNILVLTIYGFRFPASTTKIFIMAMSAYDLLNCVVGMPFEIVDLKHDLQLDIPLPCKIFRFLVSLSACGSVSALIVVAVDRFRRICQPFRKQMTVLQSKVIMGCMLVISLTFSSPALVLYGKQTDVRFNHTVYDCSIDDTFRRSSFTSSYQYILGVTWVVCIIILVVMYGFIIYTIHQQKKRRRHLSANSCLHGGDQALHSLKNSITDTSTNDSQGTAPALYGEAILKSDESAALTNGDVATCNVTYLVEDADNTGSSSKFIKEEDVDNRSLKRLFSRDVNPLLQGDSVDIQTYDFLISGGEVDVISWQKNSRPSITSSNKNESLNNFLDFSKENDFILGCDASTGMREEENISPNPDLHQQRSRKYGHYFGRYRPRESIYSSSQVAKLIQSKREWISKSFPSLDGIESRKNFIGVRRASSVPCLVNFNIVNSLVVKQMCIGKMESNSCIQKDVQYRCQQTQLNKEKLPFSKNICDFSCQSLKSLHNLSHVNEDDVNHRKPKYSNVTWDFSQIPESSFQTNGSVKASQLSLNKISSGQRSASLITLNSRKKSFGREIKTSRVSIMMLLVTLGFVLSYLPHLFLQIYSAMFRDDVSNWLCPRSTRFIFYHLFFRSFFINNSINPIIYSFYNKTFRSHCLRFIRAPKSLIRGSTNDHLSSASQDNDTS